MFHWDEMLTWWLPGYIFHCFIILENIFELIRKGMLSNNLFQFINRNQHKNWRLYVVLKKSFQAKLNILQTLKIGTILPALVIPTNKTWVNKVILPNMRVLSRFSV